jgi:bromodomain-containing protein 8
MNKPLEVLHSTINTLKGYSLFAEPVTDRLAEGYSKVVREPQDLKTIRANIRNGTISTTDEYERAIYLMFANAIMYNLPGSAAASDAKEVRYVSQTGTPG